MKIGINLIMADKYDNNIIDIRWDIYSEKRKIGEGEGLIFYNVRNHIELCEMADKIGQEELWIAIGVGERFFNKVGIKRVILIKSVEIEKRYRGKGIGIEVLNKLIKMLDKGLYIIYPSPIIDKGKIKEDGKGKLRLLWGKVGFRRIGKGEIYYLDNRGE